MRIVSQFRDEALVLRPRMEVRHLTLKNELLPSPIDLQAQNIGNDVLPLLGG